ncbi:MAG: transposase [Polyangiales bacterium]
MLRTWVLVDSIEVGWVLLGERPRDEIALGLVGKFWRPVIDHADVPPESFRDFAGPRYAKSLRVCYEARPTGYALYWQLHQMGIACEVIAPTLVPVRAGELTPIFVPDAEHQALRDLVRAREAAKKDQLRARHRRSKFLLRLGRCRDTQSQAWGQAHWRWLDSQVFDHAAQEETFVDYKNEVEHAIERVARLDKALDRALEQALEQAPPRMQELVLALQSLRGVAMLTAVTVVSEVGSFARFPSAQKFMAYLGLVPSEHSSGSERTNLGTFMR